MIKELRFRAYDAGDNTFTEFTFEDLHGWDSECVDIRNTCKILVDSAGKVMFDAIDQYTGLRDKNGTKIFTNDIIACKFLKTGHVLFKGFVCLHIGEFIVKENLDNGGFTYHSFNDRRADIHTEIEIIGNIHQHPHLLDEKK